MAARERENAKMNSRFHSFGWKNASIFHNIFHWHTFDRAKRIYSFAAHFTLCAEFTSPCLFVCFIACKFMCKYLRINVKIWWKSHNKTNFCKWKAFDKSYQAVAGRLNTNGWAQIIWQMINAEKLNGWAAAIINIIMLIITITQSDNCNVTIHWALSILIPRWQRWRHIWQPNLLFFLSISHLALRLIYDKYAINCERKRIRSLSLCFRC